MRTPGRREQKDHERYIRNAEQRKAHQRAYYLAHRTEILARKRERGFQQVVIRK